METFKILAEALLHAHGTIDELQEGEHEGAEFCKCETAIAYRLALKNAGGKL